MKNSIICGMDVHERSIKAMWAAGSGKPEIGDFPNNANGRAALVRTLQAASRRNGCEAVVTCYEACCLGFRLHDELVEVGVGCHVLAPSLIRKSRKDVKRKTDAYDAKMLLETLRGHVLAGNELPAVWVPPEPLRDDREVVRLRLEVGGKATEIKNQIGMLLKKHEIRRPATSAEGWTSLHRAWLRGVAKDESQVPPMARFCLGSLLRQLTAVEKELDVLEKEVGKLSETPPYKARCEAIVRSVKGVGTLIAMVFLTELGDMSRFRNRRQIASYIGLAPTSDETGEVTDRKGHISRTGPGRVRWALCQAAWNYINHTPEAKAAYDRIRKGSDKLKKVGLVATMRRLAIIMWHKASEAGNESASMRAA